MLVKMIKGVTRVLGKKQGYAGLPVRDQVMDGHHVMVTAWEPTPDELAALNQGGAVYLAVYADGHPPVKLWCSFGQADD